MSGSIEVITVLGKQITPRGEDAAFVATFSASQKWVRYYEIIRLLMLAGFCVLCCTAQAQDFIITERSSQSFVITERATNQDVDQKPAVRATQKRWVAMFTATYCRPCQSWKASERRKLESMGHFVREYEMTDSDIKRKYSDPKRGRRQVTRYPTFVVCEWDGEWVGDPIVGYVSAETLINRMSPESTQLEDVSIKPRIVYTQMSHSEMVSLHNRLHGPGHWSWQGDLRTHLETVHATSTIKAD